MFAVTPNTRTKGHNLELINKYKTKQQESSGWAVNQQELAAKVTDALWRMWKIYMGIKGGLNKYLEETSLGGYYTVQTITRKSLSWKYLEAENTWEKDHTYTHRGQGVIQDSQHRQVLSDQARGLLQWASTAVDKGRATDTLYMDCCKAFDMVPTTSFSLN